MQSILLRSLLRTSATTASTFSLASSSSPLLATPFLGCRSLSQWWSDVPEGPPDPILCLSVAFREDKNPLKVNLGVGAYRTDDGKPFILSCVSEAERRIQGMDHENAHIRGLPGFVSSGISLALGADSPVIDKGRIAATQVLSGTGALR